MNMLPNSMGGANISEDGYSLDGVVNTEPWIKAMTWYQGLVNDGIASRGYDADQLPDMFYSGKMVFMIGGTWTRTGMTCDDEIDCTYAPCFEGYEDKVATSTGSWYFGINSQVLKTRMQRLRFIKYFTLGEGSDMWLSINGDVPSRLDKQEEIANDENPTIGHEDRSIRGSGHCISACRYAGIRRVFHNSGSGMGRCQKWCRCRGYLKLRRRAV